MVLAGILLLYAAAAAGDCEGVPKFIGMYGDWESVAVKSEPASILEEHPEMGVPHSITGVPTDVCPGIRFVVEQTVDGETVRTQLTYVYNASVHRSYGVISSSNGARLRGILEHGPDDTDELTMLDFEGNVVWRETKEWVSADEFESVGRMDVGGQEGRIWFRTYRAGVKK